MYCHGHYYNIHNERIEVYILTDNDRTAELPIGVDGGELFFTDDPVEITSEVSDTFDHLLCNQASVRLLSRNYRPEFFNASCKNAVINIYKDGACLFAGFIEPQTYSQSYNEEFDEIELSCIDALTALQYFKYRNIGAHGVDFNAVRAASVQRTCAELITEILDGITAPLDIRGTQTVQYLYDGSKATDDNDANRYTIFSQLALNELLFLGEDEDDVWQQDELLEELLRYLNLHLIQDGFTFYFFDWATVKADTAAPITWQNITTAAAATTERRTIDITSQNVTDTDTTIDVNEIYNKITLTCDIEEMEDLIESPLDSDLLTSPYTGKQKYLTEYSSDGEGKSALRAFDAITHDKTPTVADATKEKVIITDWYMQIKTNAAWTFPNKGKGNLIDDYCADGTNQQNLPNIFPNRPAAAIIAFGEVEKDQSQQDNAPVSSIDMRDYFTISVNGNGKDGESTAYPNETSLKQGIPCAVYNGRISGGVFSPPDDDTTNYIVLSGSLVLNPIMKLTATYKEIYEYLPNEHRDLYTAANTPFNIDYFSGKTVPSRDNGDGRYYTQRWYKAEKPADTPVWDEDTPNALYPYTGTGPELYDFKYSAIGDRADHISKVAVLACMLIIGDKCVVETGTQGQPSDFTWQTYKPLEDCKDEDEYYQQSFTIGFDPKIGDKLIGTQYDFQNNISYELGLDTEGTAIPIKKSDHISGAVKFIILGPVNTLWDDITRRHPTFFRHTKWSATSRPLLAHTSSIVLEDFEAKIYSDNGLITNEEDNDIIYTSDTDESFVNEKDDITFKITSALTKEERQALGVSASLNLSTPLNTTTIDPLTTIYDHTQQQTAKPEQLYVDAYYNEYHQPRVTLTQNLEDRTGGIISLFNHYRHPYLGKTFYVQGITRNLTEARAEMTLKELN